MKTSQANREYSHHEDGRHERGRREDGRREISSKSLRAPLAILALVFSAVAPAGVNAEPTLSSSASSPQTAEIAQAPLISSTATAHTLVPLNKDATEFLTSGHELSSEPASTIAERKIPVSALPKISPFNQPLFLMTSSLPPNTNGLVPVPKL